jgi:hypothetical protein
MFLCDACHDPSKHIDLFRSVGLCEGCGRKAACIDCHYPRCPAPKKATTKHEPAH